MVGCVEEGGHAMHCGVLESHILLNLWNHIFIIKMDNSDTIHIKNEEYNINYQLLCWILTDIVFKFENQRNHFQKSNMAAQG